MMSNKNFPTYVRKDGKVVAIFEGRIIAEASKFSDCEKTAVDYLDSLHKKEKADTEEAKKDSATHVTTPNGVKGKIINRVDGLWGEKELTIRFDNGRIGKFVAKGNEEYINERTAAVDSPATSIRKELDEDFGRDRESLTKRISTLENIITQASVLLRGKTSSYSDAQDLDKLVLEATAEKDEVETALDYLKQADAVAPTAPFGYKAVEQADLGRAAGDNWLDKTADDMVKDVEGVDYDKVMLEEPGLFAAELETGTLADPESTAQMAMSHIIAKTAAFVGPEVEDYREKFVVATEVARQSELKARESIEKKKAKKANKKTSKKQKKIIDEQVFL